MAQSETQPDIMKFWWNKKTCSSAKGIEPESDQMCGSSCLPSGNMRTEVQVKLHHEWVPSQQNPVVGKSIGQVS